ncbi:hypothetical protein JD844_000288 [Phrynosoma platyrhinos]|uniref:Uncharacterized protein n=1 Tax=Phrynosoma platyrhinos TaxID=52577 RepID=A0ABQ7SQI7_PHRPL|nr:hypothetical protein JD844_000288 [Phrynosoma platyrhinos]
MRPPPPPPPPLHSASPLRRRGTEPRLDTGFHSDSENSQRKRSRPKYVEPWIVNLLLEYNKPEAREDGQFGHILKVLKDGKFLHHGEECSAVLCIADGSHYIQVVVAARALQMTTCSLPQAGFSSIVGQFILLQNYSVCFKEATNVG